MWKKNNVDLSLLLSLLLSTFNLVIMFFLSDSIMGENKSSISKESTPNNTVFESIETSSSISDQVNIGISTSEATGETLLTRAQATLIKIETFFKWNLLDSVWGFISLIVLFHLGVYLYWQFNPTAAEVIKDIISSSDITNPAVSGLTHSQLSNLPSENLYDLVINQGVNTKGDSWLNLASKLQEAKHQYLALFQEGSQEYSIEKLKFNFIKNAVLKTHKNGLHVFGTKEFTNEVNQILNKDKLFQSFLAEHEVEGTDFFNLLLSSTLIYTYS